VTTLRARGTGSVGRGDYTQGAGHRVSRPWCRRGRQSELRREKEREHEREPGSEMPTAEVRSSKLDFSRYGRSMRSEYKWCMTTSGASVPVACTSHWFREPGVTRVYVWRTQGIRI
jgi:hypothetical protein